MILNTQQFDRSSIRPDELMRIEEDSIDVLAWAFIKNSIEVQMEMYDLKDNEFSKTDYENTINESVTAAAQDFVKDHFVEVVSAVVAKIAELKAKVNVSAVRYSDAGYILDVDVKVELAKNEN